MRQAPGGPPKVPSRGFCVSLAGGEVAPPRGRSSPSPEVSLGPFERASSGPRTRPDAAFAARRSGVHRPPLGLPRGRGQRCRASPPVASNPPPDPRCRATLRALRTPIRSRQRAPRSHAEARAPRTRDGRVRRAVGPFRNGPVHTCGGQLVERRSPAELGMDEGLLPPSAHRVLHCFSQSSQGTGPSSPAIHSQKRIERFN